MKSVNRFHCKTVHAARFLFFACTLFICLLLAAESAQGQAAPGSATTDFFDSFATTAYPGAYGDVLDYYAGKMGPGATDTVKKLYEDLDKYNKAIGIISGAIDVAGKTYTGEYSEAAISGAINGIGLLAGSEGGKAALAAIGLTTAPVNVALAAFQVWRASEQALAASTVALKLEALYGSVEQDSAIKNKGRKLGEGDPIAVTPASVNHLWRKILVNPGWRDLFKVYLTEELQREWPEPSTWDRWTVSSDVLDDAALVANQQEIKQYLTGLLAYLNRLAKVREQETLARQAFAGLKKKFGSSPQNIADALRRYEQALRDLPKTQQYAASCSQNLQKAITDKNTGALWEIMAIARSHVETTLYYIPEKGKNAGVRNTAFNQLRQCYNQAKQAVPRATTAQIEEKVQEAAKYHPPRFTAVRHPFTTTFDSVKDEITRELLATGDWETVRKRLETQYFDLVKLYDADAARVQQEWSAAAGQRPLPNWWQEDIPRWYGQQQNPYRTAEWLAYSEVANDASIHVAGFTALANRNYDAAFYGAEGITGAREWSAKMYDIRATGALNLRDRIAQSGFGPTALPSTGYLGLPKLTFPNNQPGTQHPTDYFYVYQRYLDDMSVKVGNSRYITVQSPSGEKRLALSEAISSCNAIIAMIEALENLKTPVEELEKNVKDWKDFVRVGPLMPDQIGRLSAVTDEVDRFLKDAKDLRTQAISWKGAYEKARDSYDADLISIGDDIAYLRRVSAIFGRGAEVLRISDGAWQNYLHIVSVDYGLRQIKGKDYFVFRREVVPPNTMPSPDALLTKPSLMTRGDFETLRKKLIADLEAAGVLRLERLYSLTVTEYTRSRFNFFDTNAYMPENYIFLPPSVTSLQDPYCVPKDLIDTATGELATLTTDNFNDYRFTLHKAFMNIRYPNAAALLGIPYGFEGSDNRGLPLPDQMNTKLLLDAAEHSWDAATKESIRRFVAVSTEKIGAYMEYKKKEAHYLEVFGQLDALSSRFGGVEWEAQHKNDGQDLALWEKVTALEGEITGFIAKAQADQGLSEQRRKTISANMEGLKNRLWSAKEMVRNLKLRRPGSAPPPDQPVEVPIEQVRTFYQEFKNAYESKNDSVVMSYISSKWSAGDGTALTDLQNNLRNMYTVFDELRYNIANFNVMKGEGDAYRVTYDVTITGRIYVTNIKHEEKSTVAEEVAFDGRGKLKIVRTLSGKFWYTQ